MFKLVIFLYCVVSVVDSKLPTGKVRKCLQVAGGYETAGLVETVLSRGR